MPVLLGPFSEMSDEHEDYDPIMVEMSEWHLALCSRGPDVKLTIIQLRHTCISGAGEN